MKRKVVFLLIASVVCGAMIYSGSRGRKQNGAVYRVEWPVMGTVAAFQTRNEADLEKAHEVKAVFAEVERLLNAHNKESELSKLASFSDYEILEKCSPFVRPCYESAFEIERLSAGAFSPRWRGANTLDLGAIAKGFAVDMAAEKIGKMDALIDLGGNLKALGGEWKVSIEGTDEVFILKEGEACATSAEYYRGKHIKDARTGQSVHGSLYSASVIMPTSAMIADALSTVLFIFGREKGEEFIHTNVPSARIISIDRK